MTVNMLIFNIVHKLGNSIFALETNIESLRRRMGDKEPDLMDDIIQNIETLKERLAEIDALEDLDDSDAS